MKNMGMLLACFALALSSLGILGLAELPGRWLAPWVAAAANEAQTDSATGATGGVETPFQLSYGIRWAEAQEGAIDIPAPRSNEDATSSDSGWQSFSDASEGWGGSRSAFLAATEERRREQPEQPDEGINRSEDKLPVQANAPRKLPDELIVRLPMDDQYHSQLTETALPNACGPTALLMVLDYFGFEVSLESVISKHQFSPDRGGYDPSCSANPVCTSPDALVAVARGEYGLEVESHDAWTFEDVARSLASGRPLIADVVWHLADEGPGHFVVIFGIDTARRTITYHDPYDGANRSASWEDFAAAWDGPVDQGDPLKPEGHRFWAMEIAIN